MKVWLSVYITPKDRIPHHYLNLRHFNAMILIFYPSFCDVPEEGSLFPFMKSLRDLKHNPTFVSQLWSCSLGKER